MGSTLTLVLLTVIATAFMCYGCHITPSQINARIPSDCTWDYGKLKKHQFLSVSCSGQQRLSIPGSAPCTSELDMGMNSISQLNAASFSKKNLDDLKSLIISQNRINAIENDTFCNMASLRKLDMSHNNLTELSPEVFACIPNLKEVDIRHNTNLDCSKIIGELKVLMPKLRVLCNTFPAKSSEPTTAAATTPGTVSTNSVSKTTIISINHSSDSTINRESDSASPEKENRTQVYIPTNNGSADITWYVVVASLLSFIFGILTTVAIFLGKKWMQEKNRSPEQHDPEKGETTSLRGASG